MNNCQLPTKKIPNPKILHTKWCDACNKYYCFCEKSIAAHTITIKVKPKEGYQTRANTAMDDALFCYEKMSTSS